MLSKFSVKKPYTVIVGVILVIVLGCISFANMSTDLLPNMDLPYVAVYTTYMGATPEQVESDITRPMEASFATLAGINGITSTSAENLSIIIMEFESGVDMNGVMIELSSQIDMLRGSWSDSVGAPVVMQINPDTVSYTHLPRRRSSRPCAAGRAPWTASSAARAPGWGAVRAVSARRA